jgi:hypothetical protein
MPRATQILSARENQAVLCSALDKVTYRRLTKCEENLYYANKATCQTRGACQMEAEALCSGRGR